MVVDSAKFGVLQQILKSLFVYLYCIYSLIIFRKIVYDYDSWMKLKGKHVVAYKFN